MKSDTWPFLIIRAAVRLTMVLLIVSIVNAPLVAATSRKDVSEINLKNGMKILVLEDHRIPNANLYTFWKVGARNEVPGITGLSHFFEHMMFNGSKKFAPGEFDKVMESAGGANNAYTTSDVTVYTDWFPKSALEKVFELEADRMAHLKFDPKVVESERQVVASEKRTGLENNPGEQLDEEVQAAAFRAHPYTWPVIGFDSDIQNWTMDDLKNYYKVHYAPNNAVVVIVGDVTVAQVKKFADKYFAPIPRGPNDHHVRTQEPPQVGERRVKVTRKGLTSPILQMVWHVPATDHADRIPLALLADILTQGKTSRLYRALVEEAKIATTVSAGMSKNFDPGLWDLSVEGVPDTKLSGIEKIADEQLALLVQGGVTQDELDKVKNQFRLNFYHSLETINGKAQGLGDFAVFYGDYGRLFSFPDEVQKVTRDDIVRVARQYLTVNNRTVGWLEAEEMPHAKAQK